MNIEFDKVALSIEQVLGEVPVDLVLRRLSLQVSVEGADVVTLDILLGEHWECNTVGSADKFRNLRLRPRLLSTKLVAWHADDEETSLPMGFVHLLVRPIVGSQTSLGRDVDDDDGLYILLKGAHWNVGLSGETTDW